jgi:hypothetical protein
VSTVRTGTLICAVCAVLIDLCGTTGALAAGTSIAQIICIDLTVLIVGAMVGWAMGLAVALWETGR